MFYHLIDGDLASNTLSWQWVAGTSVAKRYVANQALINGCSPHKETGTYLDVRIEDVEHLRLPDVLKPAEPFSYVMTYPKSDELASCAHNSVFLYHPWSIDPLWRKEEPGERVFLIEPRLFDEFPISPRVMEHMLTLVRTHIPHVRVFVGNIEAIPGIETATVYSKAHPTTEHWPGVKDDVAELFPNVKGYHQSFFKFWQACQAY
jgi:deoxyribodipyrimidine photo-lyase